MIDATDRSLLEVLSADARLSLKEIGERVGLSSPSVAERLRRLEERGVIRAFTVDVQPQALGFTLQAIVRIRPLPGKLRTVEKLVAAIEQVAECDKVTGDDCFVARLHLRSMEELDGILGRITDHAETSTSIVKSQVVPRRGPPVRLERSGRPGR